MLCHCWYIKDADYKFEPHVCNKYHDVLMTAYELKNIAINKNNINCKRSWLQMYFMGY